MSLRKHYPVSSQEVPVPIHAELNTPHSSHHGTIPEYSYTRSTAKIPRIIPGLTPGPVNVSLNCLLVPVFVAAWWFWFKRKAQRVVTRLLHHEPETTEGYTEETDKEFSSW